MNIATAIRARLLAMTPLIALVGTRVTVDLFPQAPILPAVRVTRVDEAEDMHLRGPANFHESRIQVDSAATSKAQADAVDAAVHGDGLGASATGLLGWTGTVSGVTVMAITPIDVHEMYEADELREYCIAREYRVFWKD